MHPEKRLFLQHLVGTALLGTGAGCAVDSTAAAAAHGAGGEQLRSRLQGVERLVGGRLGVAVHDLHTGRAFSYRGDERFPMCSTFKWVAAALVLRRVDGGQENLERRIVFGINDLVDYSPVTASRTGPPGMSLAELCNAAITVSDNTAANLLLNNIGGPPGLTRYFRSLGDKRSRLDRMEPALNHHHEGELRDTTTPNAMRQTLERVVLAHPVAALSAQSTQQITQWLLNNQTGDRKLRAGFARAWRVADKTGAGPNGVSNHVAVVWPPARAPFVVAAYLKGASAAGVVTADRDAALAAVGEAVSAFVEAGVGPVR